ncbi:hypothetical protein [Runella sp. SP2]|uniref:hypothetical protein n=1 Tax=Runella sp. SP2 TaxID=2268026 RepID=UPI000F088F66|nr:hypothetical protein [Runella sp. SP2]AYQ35318.1 hypothetical protein DTQ70_25535 [Runella sp. SP2]
MKYTLLLPLLFLLGCKLEEPKEFEQYNCQLPSTISVTKDPSNGKKFSFVISESINDIAALQWTIKSANGTVVSTSNAVNYALTLATEGKYNVQANLTSKCGKNKVIDADFEATTVCNLTKNEFYFKSFDGFEVITAVTFTYNALNEVIREENVDRENGKVIFSYFTNYEKTEANLGSLTQPYIVKKNSNTDVQERIYCDLQKRIVKFSFYLSTVTYTYNSDGFLEQEISSSESSDIEYRSHYKYTETGITVTTTEYNKRTNTSKLTSVTVSLYSDKVKLPKYEVNYGYNTGKQPPKYFKSKEKTVYENFTTTVYRTDYAIILDGNNQPVSEKTITNNYSFEGRGFVFDCK